jgi:hypothetical protein
MPRASSIRPSRLGRRACARTRSIRLPARVSGTARFAAISRLQASTQLEVVAGVRRKSPRHWNLLFATRNLMAASSCRDLLTAGSQWLDGWPFATSSWMKRRAVSPRRRARLERVGGRRRDFANTRYGAAAEQYGKAIVSGSGSGRARTDLPSGSGAASAVCVGAHGGRARLLAGDRRRHRDAGCFVAG